MTDDVSKIADMLKNSGKTHWASSKSDPAHIATDEEIAKIEKLIAKEYKKAHKEVTEKLNDYLARFANKDAKWQEWVANGTKTEKEYISWRKGQMLVGKRWEDLRDSLAADYVNAAKISQSITKGFAPEVYALNHNYATFEVEKKSLLDTSYSLYSRESVEYMYKGKPKLYHTYGKAVAKDIKEGKQYAWDRRRITSVLTQSILQGESIPKITRRLEQVTKGDHKAAIRNARTMMTGVQNAGRIDAFQRALDMGIPVKKQWLSTVDMRTRHWHRALDGVTAEVEEPFHNDMGDIKFPGDPEAAAANVYNCRCTLIAAVEGFAIDVKDTDLRPMPNLGEMTYDEWRASKDSISLPIDLQEKKGQAIQGAWWKQYGGAAGKNHKFTAEESKALMDKYEQEAMTKQYSGLWANKVVTPADYPNMKKDVVDKKFYLNKQIDKAVKKEDLVMFHKYNDQLKLLEDFEKQGKEFLKAHPELDKSKAVKSAVKKPKAEKVPKTAKTEKTPKTAKEVPPAEPPASKAKEYSGIWANKTVKPEDYPGMKKAVNDKKWNLNKQIEKANAKGDLKAVAKYQKQLDDLLDFEKEGQKFLTGAKSSTAKKSADKVAKATKTKKAAETAKKEADKAAPEVKKAAKPKKISEKQAAKEFQEAQEKVDKLTEKYFDNIWAEPVTPADYAQKKESIAAKKKYFQDKYDEAVANGWQTKIDKFGQLMKDLDEFENLGKKYEAAKAEYDAAKATYEPFVKKKADKIKAKVDAIKADMASFGQDEYMLGDAYWSLPWSAKVEDYPSISKKVTAAKKSLKGDIDTYSKPYFQDKKWAQDNLKQAKEKLAKVEAYEDAGKKYKKLQKAAETAEKKIPSLSNANTGAGAYSQARKDKALWARNSAEYRKNDAIFDKHARTVHGSKSAFEHEGYYHYTWGSGPFNSPLVGFEHGFNATGAGFKGPGKVNINIGGYGDKIRGLTKLCEKSKQPVDFWVQSGQSQATLEGMLKLPYGKLRNMSDAELQQFVGKTEQLPQFISGAINKGGGSYTPGDMMFNIYCPKGSEALYVLEDGHFSKSEHEMILQRGGTYRITRIYWGQDSVHGGRKLIVDMELRLEKGYNKFQQ